MSSTFSIRFLHQLLTNNVDHDIIIPEEVNIASDTDPRSGTAPSENEGNEACDENWHIIRQLLIRKAHGFRAGLTFLHQSFLPMLLTIDITAAFLNVFVSNYFGHAHHGQSRLRRLIDALHLIEDFVRGVVNGKTIQLLMFADCFHPGGQSSMADELFNSVIRAPLLEEIIFRQIWSLLYQKVANTAEGPFTMFGHSLFALSSSLFFGLGHISNHTDDFDKALVDAYPSWQSRVVRALPRILVDAMQPQTLREALPDAPLAGAAPAAFISKTVVLPAFLQVFQSAVHSLWVYSPLYEQHGVVASFAAHAAWNLLATVPAVRWGYYIVATADYWMRICRGNLVSDDGEADGEELEALTADV
ncbi:expressed unknown protein [Seminavis robusta]|uniref:CAAX prenyl protease 2/Lysostaphin resistance protein A-like domain-containing protein n=1 Tax=Seminavis robusta TaxID=568900 RepID=A0A9N8ESI9_9STRA|nr:expressed unknown protein [Seminavis robusta]|eukprot:Sro1978_g309020.1 n/a (360) ;mRNA; r:6160-7239